MTARRDMEKNVHTPHSGNAKAYVVETLGSGGICQYTHYLCENIAKAGGVVVLVTTFGYELADLPKSYRVVELMFPYPRGERGSGLACRAGRLMKHLWNLAALTVFLAFCYGNAIHYQRYLERFFITHLRLVKLLGGRVVYTAHDAFSHEDDPKWVSYFGRVYALADRLVVLTEYSCDLVAWRFPELAGKISVVPHGNFDFLTGGCEPSLPGTSKTILFFGHIRRYKGLDVLLNAFNIIVRSHPGAQLLVVGDVAEKGEDIHDYESLLSQDARENAEFVTRYVDVADIPRYFNSADIVALPYISATQSGVAQLAYSFGRPVVASRAGGLPEQVVDGQSGRLVAPGDHMELADAICRLLDDPASIIAMGGYAKKLSSTKFAWEYIARQTMVEYRELFGASRRYAHATDGIAELKEGGA